MRKTQYSGPSRYVRITATVRQDARPSDMGSCEEEQPAGWYCTRDFHHNGPCALKQLPAASPSGEDAAEQAAAPMAEHGCCQARANNEDCNCASACARWVPAPLPRASEQADEAVTDGVAHFNWLCSLMPEGFHWGEPLTPDVLDHIASAARAKDSK